MTRTSALSHRAGDALANDGLRASVRNATGIMVDGRVRALEGLAHLGLRIGALHVRAGDDWELYCSTTEGDLINWGLPQAEFHTYLRRIVEAGFSDRIMYGTDNMEWPDSFGVAIRRTAAPFLSDDQKRDIFCRNAARFLRLGDNVCRP